MKNSQLWVLTIAAVVFLLIVTVWNFAWSLIVLNKAEKIAQDKIDSLQRVVLSLPGQLVDKTRSGLGDRFAPLVDRTRDIFQNLPGGGLNLA